jgi:hypothetical protein
MGSCSYDSSGSNVDTTDLKFLLKSRPSNTLVAEIYQPVGSNDYIIETKLNRLQYLLEVIYENGKTEIYVDRTSCENYPEIYKRMGTL